VPQVWAWTNQFGGIPMISISRGLAGGLVLTLAMAVHVVPVSAKPAASATLTPERMVELRQINSHVNNTIVEVSDRD
jgi:predicted transglutaminase-like cysteine proteinase